MAAQFSTPRRAGAGLHLGFDPPGPRHASARVVRRSKTTGPGQPHTNGRGESLNEHDLTARGEASVSASDQHAAEEEQPNAAARSAQDEPPAEPCSEEPVVQSLVG